MKKLLVLSVLLGLMIMPAFASDVTLGGDLTYGFISDFSGEAAGFAEDAFLSTDLTAVVDEINTVKWSYDWIDTGSAPSFDKVVVIHDLGAWLDLPVGAVLTVGLDDPDANEYQSLSDLGNEEVFNFSPAEYLGFDLLVDADMVQFELAMDPGYKDASTGALLIGLAAPDLMGASAEVYYFQNGSALDEYGEGQVGLDAAYATEISGIALDAGVGFKYDLNDAATDAWAYGVGLAVAYDMFGLSLGIDGNETDVLNQISGTVSVDPVELATLYAWFLMNFAEAADEVFQSAEIGVDAHVGAADMYVGYQITNGVYAPDYDNAPTLLADGGFFVKWDINY